MPRLLLVLSLILMASANAFAHPGHGNPATPTGIWHYLTTAEHAGVAFGGILLASALSAFGYSKFRSRQIRCQPEKARRPNR
ncbi:MAG: hypothetical protein Fues2KO_45140 [Fuerstiella sp.]